VAIHRIPEACKSLTFIKINLFDRKRWVPRFKIYLRDKTKIVNGKLKSVPRGARNGKNIPTAGDTIVERSIPKTREINLPMSYVCKRWPFQLLDCHGSLPNMESLRRLLNYHTPASRRDSELLIMLTYYAYWNCA